MAEFFEGRRLILPIVNNKRRISTAVLSLPLTPANNYQASSLPTNYVDAESFEATYITREADFIEIPAILKSMETLTFIRFTNATAAIL
jgi:hypothetical protein